jgi:hypothetical protein
VSEDGNSTFIENPINFNPAIPSFPAEMPSLSQEDMAYWTGKLLARTNPNVPHINLGQFVGELKDFGSPHRWWGNFKDTFRSLVRVTRDSFRALVRKTSKTYIGYRWAVKPLVNDLLALAKFNEAFTRKYEELQKLQEFKEIRRNVALGHYAYDWTAPYLSVDQSGWAYVKTRPSEERLMKTWGSVHWRVDPGFEFPSVLDVDQFGVSAMDRLVADITGGINGYGALKALWELAPWSWLIDRFANVGEFIDATNNRIPVSAHRICIMRKRLIKADRVAADVSPYVTLSGDNWKSQESKERRVVSSWTLPFQVTFPVLDRAFLSILGALKGSRLRG